MKEVCYALRVLDRTSRSEVRFYDTNQWGLLVELKLFIKFRPTLELIARSVKVARSWKQIEDGYQLCQWLTFQVCGNDPGRSSRQPHLIPASPSSST